MTSFFSGALVKNAIPRCNHTKVDDVRKTYLTFLVKYEYINKLFVKITLMLFTLLDKFLIKVVKNFSVFKCLQILDVM